MLVLSRKRGEQVFIGGDITITVVESKGSVVRIGIEAPTDVKVLRAELCELAPRNSFSLVRSTK